MVYVQNVEAQICIAASHTKIKNALFQMETGKKKGGHYGWLEVTYQSGIEWARPADSPMATCEKNARFRCVLGRPFL